MSVGTAPELYKTGDLPRIPSCQDAGRPFEETTRTKRFSAWDNDTASSTGPALLDHRDAFGAGDQVRQAAVYNFIFDDEAHLANVASVLR